MACQSIHGITGPKRADAKAASWCVVLGVAREVADRYRAVSPLRYRARLRRRAAVATPRRRALAAHPVVYPPVTDVIQSHDSAFMFGQCEGGVADRLPWHHGQSVPVHRTRVIAWLPLPTTPSRLS